jgi:hypothetical protein
VSEYVSISIKKGTCVHVYMHLRIVSERVTLRFPCAECLQEPIRSKGRVEKTMKRMGKLHSSPILALAKQPTELFARGTEPLAVIQL